MSTQLTNSSKVKEEYQRNRRQYSSNFIPTIELAHQNAINWEKYMVMSQNKVKMAWKKQYD